MQTCYILSMALTRLTRIVDETEWDVSDELGSERAERLRSGPGLAELLNCVVSEATSAAHDGLIGLHWRQSDECPGYFRLVAQVPLGEATFDQLFNGRSGYRAQYYLSPEEGILFNRDLLNGLLPVLMTANERRPLPVPCELIEREMVPRA